MMEREYSPESYDKYGQSMCNPPFCISTVLCCGKWLKKQKTTKESFKKKVVVVGHNFWCWCKECNLLNISRMDGGRW